MHSAIYQDTLLRSVALSVARNNLGAMRPEKEVISGEGITEQDFVAIKANPQFKRYVDTFTKELSESGFGFAAKSRVLAEDLLPIAYHMARDPDVPAAVRAKMLENIVEWGDLKPKKNDLAVQAAGSGFSITINMPDMSKGAEKSEKVIDYAQESVEHVEETQEIEHIEPETPTELPITGEKEPEITKFESKIPDLGDLFDDIEFSGDDFLE